MPESHNHILFPADKIGTSLPFSKRGSGGPDIIYPVRDRNTHAQFLRNKFEAVRQRDNELKADRLAHALPVRTGTYIEFHGQPGSCLNVESLEDTTHGIRLDNVRECEVGGRQETIATIFYPKGQEKWFLKKVDDYRSKDSKKGRPKNDALMRGIEDIKSAVVESLWTDRISLLPVDAKDWCEVWIRTSEADLTADVSEQVDAFKNLLDTLGIEHNSSFLHFPERSVMLVHADKADLTELLCSSDLIAEFRATHASSEFFAHTLSTSEQREWMEDLKGRLHINGDTNVSVCVLDTGVNDGHPLLAELLSEDNRRLTVDPNWGTSDKDGHGTNMCGIAAYGDLGDALASTASIGINHHLCSVKLLRKEGDNDKDELRGELTRQAIYQTEIANPEDKEIFCMAVTAENSKGGTPTSWSAAIDEECYNDGENTRLMMVSAGNIDLDKYANYPSENALYPIQDPGQAWNALTIGACTFKEELTSESIQGNRRVAPSGGISPYSTTSVPWESNANAPIKPEIMFEGGNRYVAKENPYEDGGTEDLEVLTTSKNFMLRGYFDTINGTSSATALASNLAADIQFHYPNLWPESIRGLLVNSARWTDAMKSQFPASNKTELAARIRNCGYGVVNIDRALYSYGNGMTCIVQDSLNPFKLDKSVKINEMHVYSLPWPKEMLKDLGDKEVTLRVTLSYFIEPSPGKIGWTSKYRYPSFGLRFDVNGSNETKEAFLSRINKLAELDDQEEDSNSEYSSRWTIGSNFRNKGSLHSDEIVASAAELATCEYLAVYPVGGWWKTRKYLGRYNRNVRFSLVISLDTSSTDIDLYSEVKTKVDTLIAQPVAIEV